MRDKGVDRRLYRRRCQFINGCAKSVISGSTEGPVGLLKPVMALMNMVKDICENIISTMQASAPLYTFIYWKMIYEQFGDLKFKYRKREFWCGGYYVNTAGKNTQKIQEHIQQQLAEDKLGDQLSLLYPGSPFTGHK